MKLFDSSRFSYSWAFSVQHTNILGKIKCFRQILPTSILQHPADLWVEPAWHPHLWCGFLFLVRNGPQWASFERERIWPILRVVWIWALYWSSQRLFFSFEIVQNIGCYLKWLVVVFGDLQDEFGGCAGPPRVEDNAVHRSALLQQKLILPNLTPQLQMNPQSWKEKRSLESQNRCPRLWKEVDLWVITWCVMLLVENENSGESNDRCQIHIFYVFGWCWRKKSTGTYMALFASHRTRSCVRWTRLQWWTDSAG